MYILHKKCICIYNACMAFVAMELDSSGRASADKLSWPCIKVIFSQNENVWKDFFVLKKNRAPAQG